MRQEPVTITLDDPVEAHGNPCTELTFRPPVGKDIRDCGMPVRWLPLEGKPIADPVPDSCAKYIARLAGIPPSSVDRMTADTFGQCMAVVIGFFMPTVKAISPPSSTSTSNAGSSGTIPASGT